MWYASGNTMCTIEPFRRVKHSAVRCADFSTRMQANLVFERIFNWKSTKFLFFIRLFLKFSWNFDKFFQKFSQKFSQNLDKIFLENCSNFRYCSPKISKKFLSFLQNFYKFWLKFHCISTFSLSVNQSYQNFLKNLQKFRGECENWKWQRCEKLQLCSTSIWGLFLIGFILKN